MAAKRPKAAEAQTIFRAREVLRAGTLQFPTFVFSLELRTVIQLTNSFQKAILNY